METTLRIDRPYNSNAGNGHRLAVQEFRLRIDCLQFCFNLADRGTEAPLYKSSLMCHYAVIDFGREPVSGKSEFLTVGHLL